MQARRVEKLIRSCVLPSLEGFAVKGRLLYATPISEIVRGYYFEDSGFDANALNVWAFVQPLYVPAESIVLSLGGRLGTLDGGQELWWSISDGAEAAIMKTILKQIQREGERHFGGTSEPRMLLQKMERWLRSGNNTYALEATAYSEVLVEDVVGAIGTLGILDSTLEGMNWEIPWIAEVGRRSKVMRLALTRGLDDAKLILSEWMVATREVLGLGKR